MTDRLYQAVLIGSTLGVNEAHQCKGEVTRLIAWDQSGPSLVYRKRCNPGRPGGRPGLPL